jgi:hypothetical protein
LLVGLEIQVNKTNIALHFCVAIGSLAITCMIATPTIIKDLKDNLIYQTYKNNYETLLTYSEIDEAHTFFDNLKTATEHLMEPHQHALLFAACCHVISPLEDNFEDLIRTLFPVRTWKAYLTAKDQDKRDLQLSKPS